MTPSFDFAFEGFRIIRSKPYAVLAWGLLLLVGNAAALYVLTAMAGPALQAMQQMQNAGGEPGADEVQAMLKLFPPILAGYGVAIPIQLIANAFTNCAAYRAVLGKDDKGPAWLGFGIAELRQIAVAILFSLLMFAGLFAVILAASIVAGVLAAFVGAAAAGLGVVAVVVAFFVMAVFALRLSLCGVQTFDEGRVNLFGSWKLTEGRFWWLAAGYLFTGVMVLLVYALCFAIFAAFAAVASHGDLKVLEPIFKNNGLSMDMFRKPVMIAYLAVAYGLVAPLVVALTTGAPSAAYRALRGDRSPVRLENVF